MEVSSSDVLIIPTRKSDNIDTLEFLQLVHGFKSKNSIQEDVLFNIENISQFYFQPDHTQNEKASLWIITNGFQPMSSILTRNEKLISVEPFDVKDHRFELALVQVVSP